jgi:muconolactone D-isomerase
MLFHVEMDVRLPPEMDPVRAASLKADERVRAEELQRTGKWRHLWRVVGRYANVSIFDVESPAELHDLLSTLPLYPWMSITVTALCRHPSSIRDDDR